MRVRRLVSSLALLVTILVLTTLLVNAEIERFTELPSAVGSFKLAANRNLEVVGVIPLSPKGEVVGPEQLLNNPIRLERGQIITGEMVAQGKEKDKYYRGSLSLTTHGHKTSRSDQLNGVIDCYLLYYVLVDGQRTTATPLYHPAFINRGANPK